MTATTMTPAMAGANLLDELRQLLRRHDGASSLDEVRALLDELTTTVRRGRGRMRRFAKPTPEPTKAEAAPKAAPAAEAKRPEAAPAKPPAPQRADVRIPDEPEPHPTKPPIGLNVTSSHPSRLEPLPPPGPRSWPAWIAAALLAVVSTVIALILGMRGICSLVARAARPVGRFISRKIRAVWRTVRRSP